MTVASPQKIDWMTLWRSGALPRFCFLSIGCVFHAGAENAISTLMPSIVRDIGGVELNGWSFSTYEIGSVVAGAAIGRLTNYWTVRTTLTLAALIFALGSFMTALSPSMEFMLAGRLLSGFGGGGLLSVTYVAIQRQFSSLIWPHLMAILSVTWGAAAFVGPLYGAVVVTLTTWRWAFILLALAAILFIVVSVFVLSAEPTPRRQAAAGRFPALSLLCLAAGVTSVAAAGVETRAPLAVALVATGVAGIAVFFFVDQRNAQSRLFPANMFYLRTTLGAGMIMVAMLAIATCSFGYYGPLLLSALHDYSPLTIGLIVATESVAWSLATILVAGAPPSLEKSIIRLGAILITAGIVGFAWALPNGSLVSIGVFAVLQGGGFGLLMPFATRKVIQSAPESEGELAASGFPTLQRIGYAFGAAVAGIIANQNGFSGGFTKEAAAEAVIPMVLYFVPVALIGCVAAFVLSKDPPRPPLT